MRRRNFRRCRIKHGRWPVLLVTFLLAVAPLSLTQIENIVIPAGTPEDQALQAITKEPDDQKKLAMYEDFLKQFSSNPAAVAYGNWQAYQGAGTCRRPSTMEIAPVRRTALIFSSLRPALPSN